MTKPDSNTAPVSDVTRHRIREDTSFSLRNSGTNTVARSGMVNSVIYAADSPVYAIASTASAAPTPSSAPETISDTA